MANTVVGLKNVNFLTEEQFNTTTFDNTQMYAVETAPPLTEKQITNCLTENPELVKLSLSGGTLTLEAGSTVIVPYGKSAPTMAIGDSLNGGTISDISWDGTLLFYYVRYDNAKTFVSYHNGSSFCFLANNGDTRTLGPISLMHSGTIAPTTTQYMLWYDTNNNIVKYTGDTGSTWTNYQSLVFAIASGTGGASSSAWTSIEQTFQSIGYIGSTVFALPGVKGLIPNGRNADGSLKNIEFTTDTVLITTNLGSTDTRNITLRGNSIDHPGTSGYNEISNIVWKDNGIVVNDMIAGQAVYTSGKVTSFTPKLPFRALDYNDKETIISGCIPDYDSRVSKGKGSVNEPNVAYSDCLIIASGGSVSHNGSGVYIKIIKDGEEIDLVGVSGADLDNLEALLSAFLSKGEKYYIDTPKFNYCYEIPLKGVN